MKKYIKEMWPIIIALIISYFMGFYHGHHDHNQIKLEAEYLGATTMMQYVLYDLADPVKGNVVSDTTLADFLWGDPMASKYKDSLFKQIMEENK